MAPDNELIARCQAGDDSAFLALYRAHRTDVARLVTRMIGRHRDLEDLIQEVFLQVHKSIGAFRGTAKFTTWLYRVAVNVVLMHRRAGRSRPTLDAAAETPPTIDPALLPDEQAEVAARVAAYYRLIDQLSEKKRTVYVLHELEGMSPTNISEVVEAPVLTVRTRLFYARRDLVELLRQDPVLGNLESESSAVFVATSNTNKELA